MLVSVWLTFCHILTCSLPVGYAPTPRPTFPVSYITMSADVHICLESFILSSRPHKNFRFVSVLNWVQLTWRISSCIIDLAVRFCSLMMIGLLPIMFDVLFTIHCLMRFMKLHEFVQFDGIHTISQYTYGNDLTFPQNWKDNKSFYKKVCYKCINFTYIIHFTD